MPCVINGVIGPRGDGYKAGYMNADEAEAYHNVQMASFAESEADMVTAFTLTNIDEAVGSSAQLRGRKFRAQFRSRWRRTGACREGRHCRRRSKRSTMRQTERRNISWSTAPPSHFEQALDSKAGWTKRIYGIRANASTRSHAELDGLKRWMTAIRKISAFVIGA
jgi:S-methylmethionine-dependent homocysteine/selenocysteine methylase